MGGQRHGGRDAATVQARGARGERRDCTEAWGGDLGGSPWFLRGWMEVPLMEEGRWGEASVSGSGSELSLYMWSLTRSWIMAWMSTWELPGHKWWLKPQTWLKAEGVLG